MRLVGSLGAIPTLLATGALIGFFFGQWLDKRLHTDPWLQLVFFFLGLAGGVRSSKQYFQRVKDDFDKL